MDGGNEGIIMNLFIIKCPLCPLGGIFVRRKWGLGGLLVHAVHAFEEGEEGAQVVFLGGQLADGIDKFLAAFGAAGIDGSQGLGGVVRHGTPVFDFNAVEEVLGVFFLFFKFFAPAAEGTVGDTNDGCEVFPGCAGLGGFPEGLEVSVIHGLFRSCMQAAM